jgi:hypothetical protein
MYLRRVKILGYFILAICMAQIAIYLLLALAKGGADWLIYFDPRLGLFYFESGLRGKETVAPTLVRWFSAFWIFGLALLLLSGRRVVGIYIVSELVLSLPNVLFVLAIVWANLSPAHGFSIGELLVPLIVMLVFSAVPMGIAIWVQKSKLGVPGFLAGRAETY